jgi:hypothetical protein
MIVLALIVNVQEGLMPKKEPKPAYEVADLVSGRGAVCKSTFLQVHLFFLPRHNIRSRNTLL